MDRFVCKMQFRKAMTHVHDADPRLIEQLWMHPDGLVAAGEKLVRKKCVRTTVKFVANEDNYVVKRHIERSWRHFAKQCVSRSRAEKCWTDTWFLIDRGYPTPRPIAFRENRLGVLRGNSYFAYCFVEGQTLKQIATGMKNQRLLRKFVSQLVDIWSFHRTLRVNLSDGHPANFVVDAAGKMWVIDLDKLQHIALNVDLDPILRDSFQSTLEGVFGDRFVLQYGMRKLERAFAESRNAAA